MSPGRSKPERKRRATEQRQQAEQHHKEARLIGWQKDEAERDDREPDEPRMAQQQEVKDDGREQYGGDQQG
ncbi:MAG: hypothetical protein NTZ14_16505 [Hyphomicrobiales bacterium]|nr:hypothetical protein [Hyphomicrobiales bacterium]